MKRMPHQKGERKCVVSLTKKYTYASPTWLDSIRPATYYIHSHAHSTHTHMAKESIYVVYTMRKNMMKGERE